MKKFAILLVVLLLAGCQGANPLAPQEDDPYTIKAGPEPVRYDAEYARDVCGDSPVESFSPTTGSVVCAVSQPASAPMEQDQPQEMESAEETTDQMQASSFSEVTLRDGPARFAISGALESVDSANVLRAQGADEFGNEFANTLGLGSEMMLAEPGSILMGPDFDDADMVNESPHMDWISPITQFTLTDPEEENANAAEGAFLWFTGATVDARVRNFHIVLEGKEGHNWFLLIRGLFPDGEQDADRNSTVTLTEYVAGHAQVMLYPPGAYISEENFEQVAELSHTAGRNCGNEGCSELSVMMLDLNTGAWVVIYQPQLDADWQFVDSNWR